MNEESFEKKSTKKVWIVVAIAIILVAVLTAGAIYFSISQKPEKVFEGKIKDIFSIAEKEVVKASSQRVNLELSAEIDTNEASIKTLNPTIKAIKVGTTTEVDLDQKIFNQNIKATYDGDTVINIDGLVQDEKIYFYLNELYEKYIDATDYIDGEIDLNELFIDYDTNQLLSDIEQTITTEIKETEITNEKVELNGEKVKKLTIALTENKLKKLTRDVMEDFAKNLKNSNSELKEEIEEIISDLNEELEENFSEENILEISLYTKGIKNELVKFEIIAFEDEEKIATISIIKENEKTDISITTEDTLINLIVTEKENSTECEVFINPEDNDIATAIKVATINVVEENKNEGTVIVKIYAGDIMATEGLAYENTKLDVTLNIKYKEELNCKIEKRNVQNSIKIDDLTEEDLNQVLENIEKNPILQTILTPIINSEILESAENVMEEQRAEMENQMPMMEAPGFEGNMEDYLQSLMEE